MKASLHFNLSDPDERDLFVDVYCLAEDNVRKLEEISNQMRQGAKYDKKDKEIIKDICEIIGFYTDWIEG